MVDQCSNLSGSDLDPPPIINDITAMYALALRYNNILYFIREGIKKCTRIFQKLSQVA